MSVLQILAHAECAAGHAQGFEQILMHDIAECPFFGIGATQHLTEQKLVQHGRIIAIHPRRLNRLDGFAGHADHIFKDIDGHLIPKLEGEWQAGSVVQRVQHCDGFIVANAKFRDDIGDLCCRENCPSSTARSASVLVMPLDIEN